MKKLTFILFLLISFSAFSQTTENGNKELIQKFLQNDSTSFKKREKINWLQKPELHGYVGVQTINATLINPFVYSTLLLEFPKFSLGAQYFIQRKNPSGYGFIFEYNLF